MATLTIDLGSETNIPWHPDNNDYRKPDGSIDFGPRDPKFFPREEEATWKTVAISYDPSFKEYTQQCLKTLSQLHSDWDGYGACSLNKLILAAASRFVDKVPGYLYPPRPVVVPMSNGSLQFEWDREGRSLELEFESKARFHYLKWSPIDNIEEEGLYPVADFAKTAELIRWLSGD